MTGYIHHLIANLAVAGHALVDAVAHIVHGVFPFVKVKHHQPAVFEARLTSDGRITPKGYSKQARVSSKNDANS